MFDPLSESFTADPYAVYAHLRQRTKPLYFAAMDVYLLARYDDVDAAARSPLMVRGSEGFLSPAQRRQQQTDRNWHDMPNHERFVQFSMLETDGEPHRRLRTLVLREFSKALIERQRAMILEHVDTLLDEVLQMGDVDFLEDFAARVPGHVIAQVLGVPAEDGPRLRAWSEQIVQFFDADRTAADKIVAEAATTEFYHYLKDQIDARRRRPTADLLSTLVEAAQQGRLDETELVSTAMLILAGGHGSTIDVLGTGMLALLRFPEQLHKLRHDKQLIHAAILEMFRFESPLPFFHRYASTEVEVMGRRYPTGTKFGLLYGSANRDEAHHPNADRFDIVRQPNRHLAFGRGAHLCLGNNLARLDMEVIFLRLIERTRSIDWLAQQPVYRPGLAARGLQQLPVRLVPV